MKINYQRNLISIINDNEIINVITCGFMKNVCETEIYSLLVEKDGEIVHHSENFEIFEKKKLSDILCNDVYEKIRKMMIESMFTSTQIINEVDVNNKIYNVMISPIFGVDTNIKFLLLNGYNITKTKKIEFEIEDLKIKLEESNSIKSVFLSNISHELRTPMNAIIGFSDILLYNRQHKDTDRFLKSINSNAKHLDELLNNILDFSKLESNEFDLLYENFSINDLFEELLEIFDDVNYKKNSNFVNLEFANNEDKKIISDYLRLKQVLFNIISNSIKFTENGYIRISFSIKDEFILFKVEDTGIGIQNDKLCHVFDRFWQCDSTSTKKYKGTGLGLSISKSIVEMLNGKIWVESTINNGSTFYVELPLEEIKQGQIIENKNKINFSGKTVLVIDELPINYSLLGMYLNSLNITMIPAYSGESAIEIYKKQKKKIDLIFLDLNLPDMDCSELSKKLKIISKNCDIISKSGSKKNNDKFVNYHLQKPINKDKLLLILNKTWQK